MKWKPADASKPKHDWLPVIPRKIASGQDWEAYEAALREQVCTHCHMKRTAEGHDPCIANLPGVNFACCGHGREEGYAAFQDGHVLRGQFDGMTKTSAPVVGKAKAMMAAFQATLPNKERFP